jgi:hypothetical protein
MTRVRYGGGSDFRLVGVFYSEKKSLTANAALMINVGEMIDIGKNLTRNLSKGSEVESAHSSKAVGATDGRRCRVHSHCAASAGEGSAVPVGVSGQQGSPVPENPSAGVSVHGM